MWFDIMYAIIYAWFFIATFWVLARTKSFLSATPSIADQQILERFKALARFNMYLALVQLALFFPAMILGIVVIFRHGFLGVVGVVGVNVVLVGLSLYLRQFEVKARTLPAATEELAAEHRRISESWVRKPLPDF